MRCAVFASGGGTNFQALLDKKKSGHLHVDFVLFVGNNSKAMSFQRARKADIPTVHIASSHFSDPVQYQRELLKLLKDHKVEFIILAGYMKKLPAVLIKAYHNRISNIHPALLPAFGGKGMYGKYVHQAVLDYGAKLTGVTVHLVDEEYDNGPIVLQRTVKVRDDDTAETLAERVLKVEHDSYWRAIEALAQGRITIRGRRAYGTVFKEN
jgi:formyltetrahydrofolate-dependent phosphoribosylglycinamide formyltransferase